MEKYSDLTISEIKMAGLLDTIKKIFVSTDPKALAAKAALSLLVLGAPTGLSAQEAADFAKKEPEKVVQTIEESQEKTEVKEEVKEESKPDWYDVKEEGKKSFFFDSGKTEIPAGKTLVDVGAQKTITILKESYKKLLESYGVKESVKFNSDISFEVLDIMTKAKSKTETVNNKEYLRISVDNKLIHDALDRLMTKYVKK